MPLLPTESFDFRDSHPFDPELGQRLLDLLDGRLLAAEPETHIVWHILQCAQAKRACARTFVRDVDIETALPLGAAPEALFGQQVLPPLDHVNEHCHLPLC